MNYRLILILLTSALLLDVFFSFRFSFFGFHAVFFPAVFFSLFFAIPIFDLLILAAVFGFLLDLSLGSFWGLHTLVWQAAIFLIVLIRKFFSVKSDLMGIILYPFFLGSYEFLVSGFKFSLGFFFWIFMNSLIFAPVIFWLNYFWRSLDFKGEIGV